jgi:hypothetical protein
MTVASEVARVSYPGTGSVGPFAIPFRFLSFDDLAVIRRSSAGAETELLEGIGYTGTGERDASGTLTLTSALAVGETLAIVRDPAIEQNSSFRNQGAYFASAHEDALDAIVMEMQALKDRTDAAFKLPASVDPATYDLELTPETGKALVWQSPTRLGNSTIDTSAIAVPGAGRTVATTTAYLLNNAHFNIRDYGATGSGSTSDRTAIFAAHTAAVAAGGAVYFPP